MTKGQEQEIDSVAAKTVAWLNTPEGQAHIRAASERAHETILELRKAQHIDWWRLYEPFTI